MAVSKRVDVNSEEYRLGQNIRRRREALGLSQHQLCDIMNMDRAAISNYENGMKGEMGFKTLKKFSRALSVSADELLGITTSSHTSDITLLEQLSEENVSTLRTVAEALILKQNYIAH